MKNSNQIRIRSGCLLVSILLAASSAMAQAYEPFNYPVGSAPGNGGTGWAGGWTAKGAKVVGPDLALPDCQLPATRSEALRVLRLLVSCKRRSWGPLELRLSCRRSSSPLSPGTTGTQASCGQQSGWDGQYFYHWRSAHASIPAECRQVGNAKWLRQFLLE
jgi:hypothetical protein